MHLLIQLVCAIPAACSCAVGSSTLVRSAVQSMSHAPKRQRRALASGAPSDGSPQAASACSCWLLKSEPSDYSIEQMEEEGRTVWDGVRSAAARKHMRAMRIGDRALFYHSSCGDAVGVVGEIEVASGAYADPADAKWSVIDVSFMSQWPQRVSLAQMKSRKEAELKGLILFEQARLSVQPVSEEHYEYIKGLGRGDERRELT